MKPCLCCLLFLGIGMLDATLGQNIELAASLPRAPIQALLPFGNRLWLAQENQLTPWERGAGIGQILTAKGVGGGDRAIFAGKDPAILGAAIVDAHGQAEALTGLLSAGLVGVCRHPGDHRLCFLTEDGRLLGADLQIKEVAPIFENLPKALGLGSGFPRMRALYAAHDRLYIANDAEVAGPYLTGKGSGRLAEWDWRGAWRIVESAPFVDIVGVENPNGERGDLVFALGYDDLSVLLRVYVHQQWKRFRLPWRERPHNGLGNRLREISPDQWLMLAFGNFYTLQAPPPELTQPRVRPLSAWVQPLSDFCIWDGAIMLAGGQQDRAAGTRQPLLQQTTLNALTSGPKPTGEAALWRNAQVAINQVSDSLLVANFAKKTVHISNDADTALTIDLEIDALNTEVYRGLFRLEVPPHSYVPYILPEGYSATWLRLRAVDAGLVTAEVTLE